MNIANPKNETLQQLLPLVQSRYPKAVIKKVFISPEAIFVPQSNYKFVVRKKTGVLKIDHTLPVLYALLAIVISVVIVSAVLSIITGHLMLGAGGALWIILGVVITKYLFQYIKKNEFDSFKAEMEIIVSGFDFEQRNAPAAKEIPAAQSLHKI